MTLAKARRALQVASITRFLLGRNEEGQRWGGFSMKANDQLTGFCATIELRYRSVRRST